MARTTFKVTDSQVEKLRAVKERHKLSNAELASRSQLNEKTISRILKAGSIEASAHKLLDQFLASAIEAGTSVKLMTHDEVDKRFNATLEERIFRTERDLRISGVNLGEIFHHDYVGTLLKRWKTAPKSEPDRKVKLIILDPDSDAPSQFVQYDQTWTNAAAFRENLREKVKKLNEYKDLYGNLIEFRLLKFVMPVAMFISDAHLNDGIVTAKIYCVKPWREPEPYERPNIVFDAQSEPWRKYFLRQWENYWNIHDSKVKPAITQR